MTDTNNNSATRTALIGVFTGAAAVVIMVVAAVTSNSVAVIADLMATIFEWVAVFFSWLTLRRLQRKSTFIFDYGYGKLENLVSMVMAVLIFMSLSVVVVNAARRFAAPQQIAGFGIWLTIAAHGIYLVINGILCYRTHKSWKQSPATILVAQRRLFGVKAFNNTCMIIALTIGMAFSQSSWAMYFDPIMSLAIAASMFLCAYAIVRQNLGALLDRTLDEDTQMLIVRALANYFDEYEALHGVRSRRSGNKVFVELFLQFDGKRTMAQVQEKIDLMKEYLERTIPHSEVSIIPSTRKPGSSFSKQAARQSEGLQKAVEEAQAAG